jgi:integrase/recombinase XerD
LPYDNRGYHPAAQAYDRGHECAQALRGHTKGHVRSCKRFAAFLKRSPDTATLEDIRRFQLHLADTGVSICTRNVIMTGLRFLFRVTLPRLDLAAEMYHLRAPQKIPLLISTDEAKRLLGLADNLKARVMLSLSYGCGLRAGEVVRLRLKHIDSAKDHSGGAVEGPQGCSICCGR